MAIEFSDDNIPGDFSSSGPSQPMGFWDYQKQRFNSVAGDEDMATLWNNIKTGKFDDPGAKMFWNNMVQQMSFEINRETQRAKKAAEEYKKSIEGRD